jgi:hypothetical protein
MRTLMLTCVGASRVTGLVGSTWNEGRGICSILSARMEELCDVAGEWLLRTGVVYGLGIGIGCRRYCCCGTEG